jgi:hypothetical protein
MTGPYAGSAIWSLNITGCDLNRHLQCINCNGVQWVQIRKCRQCGKELELNKLNFRFTRGYFRFICRKCEVIECRKRYQKRKRLGIVQSQARIAGRRDIAELFERYKRIFEYLRAHRINPSKALASKVDKVLEKAAL